MKKGIHRVLLVLGCVLVLVSSGIAATVDGHAYKFGESDHSGITIDLEPVTTTPTLSGLGVSLLLAGMTFLIFRKRIPGLVSPMVICLVGGLHCMVYAGYLATMETNAAGEYDFANVEPGDYSIHASAPGFYPESISNFTVTDGANTVPDIILYPMEAGDLISTDPIIGNMRYVPGGTFTQGSPGTEPCRVSNETQFDHTLTRNLAVMETELTRQMWADLLSEQPTLPADPSNSAYSPTMSHPVQSNTWYDAVLFANLLSMQNGYTMCYYTDAEFTTPIDVSNYTMEPFFCDFDADGYRLPTEGEWEYFCRGETTTAFSCNELDSTNGTCGSPYCVSGEFPVLEQYAAYCANRPGGFPGLTEPVGSKLSNPWSLKDIHGNVCEWCWDWFEETYPAGPEMDYEGAVSGLSRVIRGGGWYSSAQYCRSAGRSNHGPGYCSVDLGARFLRSID